MKLKNVFDWRFFTAFGIGIILGVFFDFTTTEFLIVIVLIAIIVKTIVAFTKNKK